MPRGKDDAPGPYKRILQVYYLSHVQGEPSPWLHTQRWEPNGKRTFRCSFTPSTSNPTGLQVNGKNDGDWQDALEDLELQRVTQSREAPPNIRGQNTWHVLWSSCTIFCQWLHLLGLWCVLQ